MSGVTIELSFKKYHEMARNNDLSNGKFASEIVC